MEALRAGDVDAALLPPEKAFLAEAEGFSIVADCNDLECQWVPLATTRKYLAADRELAVEVASDYRASIGFFNSETRRQLKCSAPSFPD